MADSATEHSLLRARSAHSSHSHFHRRPRHQHTSHGDHEHNREHYEDPPAEDVVSHGTDGQPQRREPQDPSQLNADNLVTQVIQTVSLIQYVDPAGSAYETQTFLGPPNTFVVDPISGNTVNIPPPNDSLTAVDIPPSAPPVPPAAPVPTDILTTDPIVSASPPLPTSISLPLELSLPPVSESSSTSSESAPSTGSESVSQSLSVTSAPSSSTTSESSIASESSISSGSSSSTSSRNSTSSTSSSTLSSLPVHLGNSTVSAQAVSTPTELVLTSSPEVTSSQSRQKSKSRITLSTDDIYYTTTASDFPSSTAASTDEFGGTSNGGGGTGGVPELPEPTSAADSDPPPSGGLTPENKQVIGGVVGGVAGIAVFAMLLFLLLRYKRRNGGQSFFGSAPSGNQGMITESEDRGPSGPSGPSMTQRSGAFGVSAALASLNRKAPPEPSGAEERGFQRISGRKLPSVLHAGGDGYTDPRESVMSGNSDYYRGSQEFDPTFIGGGRLALGTPMRPVSGVPVIRSGPARTPVAVTEENPFDDPLPLSDPVGRSLIGQDGSRGSGSRFQERL